MMLFLLHMTVSLMSSLMLVILICVGWILSILLKKYYNKNMIMVAITLLDIVGNTDFVAVMVAQPGGRGLLLLLVVAQLVVASPVGAADASVAYRHYCNCIVVDHEDS